MAKKRTSISINERLHLAALAVMQKRNFDDFSEYVEALVRADVEAQSATFRTQEPPAAYQVNKAAS
jgi:hypothetical protein